MKVHVFRIKRANKDQQMSVVAIPADKIISINTVYGSHSMYCVIMTLSGNYSVDHTFDEVVKMLDPDIKRTFLRDLIAR